ncbi:MAG: glycosyltransferase [Candidatus Wallbacteria bacterium]|nr:glycosyltransferase [Candidatus Wallbacteria bacterium]
MNTGEPAGRASSCASDPWKDAKARRPDDPSLSVVVVHHRGREMLRECLASLAAQSFADFEVVLVANGVEPPELTEEIFPPGLRSRLVSLSSNAGFAGGANAGIRVARSPLIALLNDDAVADPAWAAELVGTAGIDGWADSFASRVLRAPDGRIVDSAGDLFSWFGEGFSRGAGLPDGPAFDSDGEVFGASACAALYRREFFARVGLFDESFFHSYEDVDLSVRARLVGLACVYVAGARVVHRGAATRRAGSCSSVFHQARNVEFVFWCNLPAAVLLRALPWHLARGFWGLLVHAARAQLGPYVLGKLDLLRHMTRILRLRSRRLASARVTARRFAAKIDPDYHWRRMKAVLGRLDW